MPSQSKSNPGKKNRDKPGRRIPLKNRKGTKKAMFGTQREWEKTFDAMPDLIAIMDGNYRILRVNLAMAQYLGLTTDQCAGKICYKLVHGVDKPPDFCPHTLALADGREHIAEIHEDSLGGDILVSITPLTDEHGRNFRTVHVARNITQRKQIEKALIEAQQDLKHAQAVAHTG
ncbi:MAG TPA: PAS domain-containing protein, partial [Thermodesulfobacteriota bacterium]|nr:PAS domain-containing protein [Thermodesulfobacteriota bacterium]